MFLLQIYNSTKTRIIREETRTRETAIYIYRHTQYIHKPLYNPHISIFNIHKENRLIDTDLPTPMTFSILMHDASISLANSLTAWLGSSYVKGST